MITRKQWNALPLTRFNQHINATKRTGIVLHHTVTAEGKTQADVMKILKTIEHGHIQRGLGGIGYNLAVDYAGRTYEARGVDILGAHIANANGANYGIAYIGDTRKRISEDAIVAIRNLVLMLERRSKRNLEVFGHGDVRSTACPGPKLTALIEAGTFVT